MTRTRALCMWKEEHNACPGRTEKQVAGGTATFHRRLAGSQPGTSVTGMMPTLSLFYLYSFPSPPQPSFSVSVLRVSIDPPLRYDSHHRSLERSRRRTYTYAFRGSFFARCIRLPSGFNVSKFHPLSGVNDLWLRERKRFWRMIAISLFDFEKE